ncbi:MAG: exodeoxyribonuclease III [Alphaproteobacteria bacterium]|jgi:exodeoxyribonuclease-3|nr:exodeoxyribonuclease III [Candidatus Jidaibacter sp.]
MAQIVCWNLNSVNSRLPNLLNFLTQERPDVLLLQEIKCLHEKFPNLELEDLGYNCVINGQKTYNGVAILSKGPIEDSTINLPNFTDAQARYIECVTTINNKAIRVASVYVPNGQEVGSDKFAYKLEFMEALNNHLQSVLSYQEVFAIGGDFNVAPYEIDVHDPKALDGTVGFHIEERKRIHSLMNLGLYDSFRCKHPNSNEFSWWDYRAGSLQNNRGMRIDQIYLSPEGMDVLSDATIYKSERLNHKTSDHAPIGCVLSV